MISWLPSRAGLVPVVARVWRGAGVIVSESESHQKNWSSRSPS